ncbi:MAG: hypothetical protein GYB65_23455 [Chloroflexi bacterium]|nr:hypothetical protein [Chloroflexota bacterium]
MTVTRYGKIPKGTAYRARRHLDGAFTYYRQGDGARAVEHLGTALELNPALHNQTMVANFIEMLLDLPLDEALPQLVDPDARAALIERLGGKARLKVTAQGPGVEHATWPNVALLLGAYALLAAVATALILGVALPGVLDEFATDLTTFPQHDSYLKQHDLDSVTGLDVLAVLVIAGGVGIGSAGGWLLQGAVANVVAVRLQSGTGTLNYLLWRNLRLQIVALGAICVPVFILMLLVPANPWVIALVFFCLTVGIVLTVYLTGGLITSVYAFDGDSGASTLFLSLVTVLVAGIGLILALSALL